MCGGVDVGGGGEKGGELIALSVMLFPTLMVYVYLEELIGWKVMLLWQLLTPKFRCLNEYIEGTERSKYVNIFGLQMETCL